MLKITFLDVGQGDSIIVEWKDDDDNDKIGIIDCNSFGNRNPVINYLQKKTYSEIEFMILSHPHTDHFSGFVDLFEYCTKKNIKIKTFGLTGNYGKAFIQSELSSHQKELLLLSPVNGLNRLENPQKKLKKFYENLKKLKTESEILQKRQYLNDSSMMLFNKKDILFRVIAPSDDEISEYFKKAYNLSKENDPVIDNNPDANLLATLIEIKVKDTTILLTSDVNAEVFNRINNEYDVNNVKIIQVPHHGSKRNHNEFFWKKNIFIKDKIDAMISVGEGYGHPSKNVVAFFDKYYNLHSTNCVGGLYDYLFERKDLESKNSILNLYNDDIEYEEMMDTEFGTKVFLINENGTVTVK